MTWRASFVLLALVVACGGSSNGIGGAAGNGGTGGVGATGGAGGTGGADLCEGVTCEDTECRTDGVCDASSGMCDYTPVANGTACTDGECLDGVCAPVGAFACTEQGIRDAIAEGGGPHFFACDGPTTVVINAVLMIDNEVILDGEGQLAVEGDDTHPMLEVAAERTVELRGFELGNSVERPAPDIVNLGMLTLTRSRLFTSDFENDGTLTMADSTMARRPDWNVTAVINNSGVLVVTNSSFRGVVITHWSGAATVDGSTFSGASTPPNLSNFSGIANRGTGTVTLKNSTVSASGFVGIENSGTMTIENSTISGNRGSGIANYGALTVTHSTVSGNNIAGSGTGTGTGGGIHNNHLGTLTLTNSTVSGNTADVRGGGIFNQGTVTLTNSTVSGNTAPDGGGIYSARTVTLTNTLMDDPCAANPPTSLGGNLESPGNTCGFDQQGDQVNVSAGALALGPLQDNDGPTMTHALLPGSVAIDVIPADMCEVDEDQRGEPRPGGTMCDVGAFEVQP